MGTAPDGIMRPQPTWASGRIAYLLAAAGRCLPEAHQLFADRVRRSKGDKGLVKGKVSQRQGQVQANTTQEGLQLWQPAGVIALCFCGRILFVFDGGVLFFCSFVSLP